MPLIAERSVMLAPGACFVCELSPNEGEPVFDTHKEYTPGFLSPLAGRKYVCLSCATSIAEGFGFTSDEVAKANAERAADADARVAAIFDQVASVVGDLSPAALQAAIDGHARFVPRVDDPAVVNNHGIVPEPVNDVPGVNPDDEKDKADAEAREAKPKKAKSAKSS